jgi:DNA topoisomerase-1
MALALPETWRSPAAADPAELVDPAASARAAGLRYVSDQSPGIRRKRVGKAFSYIGTDGRPIHDLETIRRIKSLVIPPAWIDVWICPG